MVERSREVAVCACPECDALLALERPCQAEVFPCPLCDADLQVTGGFVEALGYGTAHRIYHLT